MQFDRAAQRGEGEGDAVEEAGRGTAALRLFRPFRGLLGFPREGLALDVATIGVGEDVGMAADHLLGDMAGDGLEIEGVAFFCEPRVKDDLEQQVAQLVLEGVEVVLRDGVGDLVGFLDGVRRDGRKILFAIPGAAAVGIAQPVHDGEEFFEGGHRGGEPSRSGSRPDSIAQSISAIIV